MKEIFENFSALAEVRDMVSLNTITADFQDTEDDQEILKNLGTYVEARLKLPRHDGYSSHQYETAKTVHITPNDYEILKQASIPVETPSWAASYSYADRAKYSRRNPSVGLRDDALSPVPSCLLQVDKPAQRTSYGQPQQ